MAASQTLLYSTSSCGALPGTNIFVHGQTVGFSQLAGSAINSGNSVDCRNWTYESPNSGGSGNNSIGYWGNIFGSYSGCDLGITQTGIRCADDRSSDQRRERCRMDRRASKSSAMCFAGPRRPSPPPVPDRLPPATYYVKVTVVDAAGRESAPSPEISQAVGASSSISLSATTAIYFPASCNFYFGTSPGSEAELISTPPP